MPLGMKVQVAPEFRRSINRFQAKSNLIVEERINALVMAAAKAAQREARLHLKDLVYTAPLPPSAYRIWPDQPEKYYAMDSGGYRGRRTGRVFKAVLTRRVAPNIADMYVDHTNRSAYYYAWILNFGGSTINYPHKPFFSITVKVMRARFRAMGGVQLTGMKSGFLGLSTNVAIAEDIGP